LNDKRSFEFEEPFLIFIFSSLFARLNNVQSGGDLGSWFLVLAFETRL
jgi:hypothetical protein